MDSSDIIGASNSNSNSNVDLKSTTNRIVYTRRPRKKKSSPGSHTTRDPDVVVAPKQPPQSPPKDDSCAGPEINDEVENLKTPSPLDNAKKTPHHANATNNLGEHSREAEADASASEGDLVVQINTTTNDDVVINKPLEETQRIGDANVINEPLEEARRIGDAVVINKPLEETRRIGDDGNDKVIFKSFKETPHNDFENLKKRLESELHQVTLLVQKLEARKIQIAASYATPTPPVPPPVTINNNANSNMVYHVNDNNNHPQHFVDNRVLTRVNESRPMAVLSRAHSDMRNPDPRPYQRQLSVAVTHRDTTDYFLEKEKRTPKANQYYPNSEFLLGKDRLPPETNKRFKLNNGNRKQQNSLGFGFSSKVFKSCSALLQKLMKHKFGWVFNAPVDAKVLNLIDYHVIIKCPMDLGTIKTRLSEKRYMAPVEFAEDVRLVFRNAMTYNPIGHDVHTMAQELSNIFEERWAVIETEYNHYLNGGQMYHDLPTPTPRGRPPAQSHFPTTAVNMLATTESVTPTMVVDPKIHRPHIVRTPVPKKPKARDINKRDMTFDEKQKLSSNLQGLPSEKLDAVVQIIKRRNTTLSQHDDEIEVDIDSVDAETLWELDRFVTNFKKGLSKNKRKAELAQQAGGTVANATFVSMNTGPAVTATQLEKPAFGERSEHPSMDGQKQQDNDHRSSSSSSSSSGSGSSSDSDSDSSSADGSSHSPKN